MTSSRTHDALTRRCGASLERSRARRASARRLRRRRLRLRGGGASVATVVLALAVAGAGVAVGQSGSSEGSTGVVLSSGSRGDAVAQLQRALGVAADGVYGPRTRAAVKAFQRRNGLAVDGAAGPQTLGALGIRATTRQPAEGGSGAGAPAPAALEQIAQCESGGNPRAIGGGGRFRGKYQFTYETWRGVGGSGDPAAAPEAEQDRRAAILYRQRGSAPWPVCGR